MFSNSHNPYLYGFGAVLYDALFFFFLFFQHVIVHFSVKIQFFFCRSLIWLFLSKSSWLTPSVFLPFFNNFCLKTARNIMKLSRNVHQLSPETNSKPVSVCQLPPQYFCFFQLLLRKYCLKLRQISSY